MGKGNMYSFKDYLSVDYTQTGDELLALNAKKRKSSDDTGPIENKKEVDEALTMLQRQRMRIALRKNKAKIELGRKRSSRRIAPPDVLQRRAIKKARNIITRRILKNKDKQDLSYGQRQSLEKQLAKRKGGIKRLATRLLPIVRKKDKEKFIHKTQASSS